MLLSFGGPLHTCSENFNSVPFNWCHLLFVNLITSRGQIGVMDVCSPQTNIETIRAASLLSTRHSGIKADGLVIKIMCPTKATCRSVEIQLSVLIQYKPNIIIMSLH